MQESAHEIEELRSEQEETDTLTVLYLKYAAKLEYKSAAVRTPGTDIFVILLHHAHKYSTDNLPGYKNRQTSKNNINITELADTNGKDYCPTILGLYAFTEEDITSAFKGKGKVGTLKKL